MQNKKMTNPTDGINESNKKLRAIYDQLCCLTGAVNDIDINVGDIEIEVDQVEELLQEIIDTLEGSASFNEMSSVSLAAAGTQTFVPNTVHSFAWELGVGASIQISNGTTTNSFSSNGNLSFSTLNTQTLTITAVGGPLKLIYLY
jgi:hypothetical protein